MTNTDEQAFMTAILAEPDDNTPRLVFADWLDERGSEEDRARAALIRAQCRLEILPANSKERTKLTREAQKILRKHEGRWTKPIRSARLLSDITFRRGFLDGGSMSPTTFVQRGEELFRLAPTLRTLRFPNAANEVTDLAESPFLARLASVDLTLMCTCGMCGIDDELRDLFKSKHAANLRCLNVSRDRIDATVMRALVRSTVLGNLTSLDLSSNPLGGAGAETLAKSKLFGKLKVLNLSHTNLPRNRIQKAGIEAFAAAKHFSSLTHLKLSGNRLTGNDVMGLIAAPFFKQLTALDLSNNRISEGGSAALANLPSDAIIESLDVSRNLLSAKAVARLKARFGSQLKV